MFDPLKKTVTAACFVLLASVTGLSQSQALDAQLEGFVYDQNLAVLTGAEVTATNTTTGFTRNLTTDGTGFYRMPLMPLGTYRMSVEAPNHMRAVKDGITLVTGQTATIDFFLKPAGMVESVTVTADGTVVDTGKTDLGRVMTSRETSNLPLVAMNPHNFALHQANVNGRPSRGYNFPNISANGYLRRVNYLLDGNSATQADRAGVRLMQISGVFVKEVQLVSNAFAPEFGNTPGLIMNVVTPTGSNEIDGSIRYLFRRPSFYSRPFNYTSPEKLPDNRANVFAASIGFPIAKDRWHLYAGYEWFRRDDIAFPNRILSISEADRARLIDAGLPANIFPPSIPTLDRGPFAIVRSDLQINDAHRLALRFNGSNLFVENNIPGTMPNGVTNSLHRSTDVRSADRAVAAQLVSYTSNLVNEFRVQSVWRKVSNLANEFSGAGPSIVITQLVNFGAPEGIDTITPLEKQTQFQDNITLVRGAHIAKFGGGFIRIFDLNRAGLYSRYTFATIDAYLVARDGVDPRSYSRYDESSGDPEISYRATFWNSFAQDDWKVSSRLKFTFGLRYDLYNVPKGDPTAAYEPSRKFSIDKDNVAPRVAAVYVLRQGDRPTILRAGAGLYYETPWLDMYERALRLNGNPRYFNFVVRSPLPDWAPAFPAMFPKGLQLSAQDIDAVSPDLENLYAIHANAHLEQAFNANASLTVGYVHSGGRQIPIYRSINHIPVGYLPDGRAVFGTAKYDQRFNSIWIAESAGRSRYDALNVQFNVRSMKGVDFSAMYTLSKATDDAPQQNLATGAQTASDPYDRRFDQGRSLSDQRHTLVASMVARPVLDIRDRFFRRVLNDNQLSLIILANSGQAFNILSDRGDLNSDGVRQDRPLGVTRNSGTTPPLFDLDLRYSRFVPLGERYRLELFAEFTNFFNVNSIIQYNNVEVATDSVGTLIGGIPNFRSRNQNLSQESRQTQLGIKFLF